MDRVPVGHIQVFGCLLFSELKKKNQKTPCVTALGRNQLSLEQCKPLRSAGDTS